MAAKVTPIDTSVPPSPSPSLDEVPANDLQKPHCYDVFCHSDSCESLKLVIGTIAVAALLLVLFIGVAMQYSILQVYPAVNFVLMVGCLILLAYVEALHYACVAVEKWDMSQYAERYPRAVKCHTLVNTPEKVKKFLVGRQFFVIL